MILIIVCIHYHKISALLYNTFFYKFLLNNLLQRKYILWNHTIEYFSHESVVFIKITEK